MVDLLKALSVHRQNYVACVDLKKDFVKSGFAKKEKESLTLLDLATAVPGKISEMMMGRLCSWPPMMAMPEDGMMMIILAGPVNEVTLVKHVNN